MIDEAMAYALAGWYVFPCSANGKTPLTKNGCLDATIDPKQIKEWFGIYKAANIAIATGAKSGLIVVDIDIDKSHNGKDGIASLEALKARFGEFDKTLTATTPSGGKHLYYALGDLNIGNSASKLSPGLDIRGIGGYVLAPPSTIGGRPYQWDDASVPVARFPAQLAAMLERQSPAHNGQSSPAIAPASGILQGARNDTLFRLGCKLRAYGMSIDAIRSALHKDNELRCNPPLDAHEVDVITNSIGNYNPGNTPISHVAPPTDKPSAMQTVTIKSESEIQIEIANEFLRRYHTDTEGVIKLRTWRGTIMEWDGTCYKPIEEDYIISQAYYFLGSVEIESVKKAIRYQANTRSTNELLRAIKAVTHLSSDAEPPYLLDTEESAQHMIPCLNGILDLDRMAFTRPSPHLFSVWSLGTEFIKDAKAPQWNAFLGQLWGESKESILLLQEIFGYLISGATNHHKIIMLIGPPRSGKSTIMRIISALFAGSTAHPMLSSFDQQFALQQLVGKSVAIISDARSGPKTDIASALEKILSISGEDKMAVARKFKDDWIGYMICRIILTSNEVPRLADASGALVRRILPLKLTKSFAGREDTALTDNLLGELPGILVWAIEGLKRFRKNGEFTMPLSSTDLLQDFTESTAPISAFIDDVCTIADGAMVRRSTLFEAYTNWCKDNGIVPLSNVYLGRQLKSAVPSVSNYRSPEPGLPRYYKGIGLIGPR